MVFQNRNLISQSIEGFQGFNLSFLEIEILRAIYYYKLRDIGSLYTYLSNKYKIRKLSKSQFYRLVDKLQKNDYLLNMGDRKEKQLYLTQKGKVEIASFLEYTTDVLKDEIFNMESVMLNLLTSIAEITIRKCLRKINFMQIGVFYVNLHQLQLMCDKCEHPFDGPPENYEKPYNIKLPNIDTHIIGIDDTNREIYFAEMPRPDPFNILLKDASMEGIVSTLLFNRYSDKDREKILKELFRILKPGGWLVVFEPTANLSSIVVELYNMISIKSSLNMQEWRANPETMPTKEEMISLLENYSNLVYVKEELVIPLFFAQKPMN